MLTQTFLPQDVIRKKRDQFPLTSDEISSFVRGIADQSVSDSQIAALGMAVFFNGMSAEEGANLTLAMRDSGDVIKWQEYGFDSEAPIVDKHSTGGVGDKVSFMLAAIVAACGAVVPMIAGRGLGHTGGTIDKLEAIPGYDTMLDTPKFVDVVRRHGCSIIGQTSNLAPADKRFYAVRDVTSTVESIPLITASILSKKLAAGLHSLVMDVKFGNGAFMETAEQAEALGRSIVRVATAAGVPTSALLTDMNQVLGTSAGNSVEIYETIEFLKNPHQADTRLKAIVNDLAAEMLWRAGLAETVEQGAKNADRALSDGRAAEKFAKMVELHGGPADLMENPEKSLSLAPYRKPVFLPRSGFISSMKTRDIGQIIVSMKGGRAHPDEDIDHSVGFSGFLQNGDAVDAETPVCMLYARDEDQWTMAADTLIKAITVSEEQPSLSPITQKIIRD
ncbi:thymidine phosphorylase [Temperatibacter marinus]|uniref:Thymidine phosphorylase n=1 Tax=Temperatibacter marinus TaxID=1456591 RepID=A0AA52EGM8_9PROT|nr:thymidine phosphorylase [Temperatibacter marinus]WND01721.1 thymidine phosphorylase [Temperatibacter marinus]